MKKKRILFVCIHNSARSQLAEALMNRLCGEQFEAESAGLEPGVLNPLAVEILRQDGIDIRTKPTRSVLDLYKTGELYAFVVTVCDEAAAERCPIFAGVTTRLHWGFPDPSKFDGTWDEKLQQTRKVRDAIELKIREFCKTNCS